ncbi:hypothetical protein J2S55_005313 [Streptosporangium brasiliense]|uniref:Uncharacterized protein n=1 Tax=Streptosporangium brasiliense TaxID=47480 RepID=A0ABT9RB17_9ACTN|nr:hypothetical protein [Streptosporangium brasiliense]
MHRIGGRVARITLRGRWPVLSRGCLRCLSGGLTGAATVLAAPAGRW